MARKAVDLQQQKQARQKKMLFVLAPLLLGLLAWQGPKTVKAFTGGEAAPLPPVPAVTTTPAPAGSAATSGAQAAAPAGGLPDSERPYEALDGQLISFSRFAGRDPFDQSYAPATDAPPDTSGEGADTSAEQPNSAEIEVNGAGETVAIGEAFPASDPTFELISVSGQTAVVGLVSGSFSNGAETIAIDVGETLVLVSDPDQTRYAIKIVGVAYVKPS
jgi:hypothetical protein